MQIDEKDLIEEITYLIGQIKDPQKTNQTLEELHVITDQSVKVKKVSTKKASSAEQQTTCNLTNMEIFEKSLSCQKQLSKTLHQYWVGFHQLKIIQIQIVPTVPHCHLVQQIGLLIRFQLKKQIPNYQKYKIHIFCKSGTHNDSKNVEKQINDKERVQAAFQNPQILSFLEQHTFIS